MLGSGIRRRKEKEDQVDLLAVDRLVFDRIRQTGEQAVDPAQTLDLAVRDGDSMAETGRAQSLTFADARENLAGVGIKAGANQPERASPS